MKSYIINFKKDIIDHMVPTHSLASGDPNM